MRRDPKTSLVPFFFKLIPKFGSFVFQTTNIYTVVFDKYIAVKEVKFLFFFEFSSPILGKMSLS